MQIKCKSLLLLLGLLAFLGSDPLFAQTPPGSFFPSYCRSATNPTGAIECVVGTDRPASWTCGSADSTGGNGVSTDSTAGSAEACVAIVVAKLNAYFSTFDPLVNPLRFALDPLNPGCAVPRTSNSLQHPGGNQNQTYYISSCSMVRYDFLTQTPAMPQSRSNVGVTGIVSCPVGWTASGSGVPEEIGTPHICSRDAITPPPLTFDTGFGCSAAGNGSLICSANGQSTMRTGSYVLREVAKRATRHIAALNLGKTLHTGTIIESGKSRVSLLALKADGVDDSTLCGGSSVATLSLLPTALIPPAVDTTSSSSYGVASLPYGGNTYVLGHFQREGSRRFEVGVMRLNAAGCPDTTWGYNSRWSANVAAKLGLLNNDEDAWDTYGIDIRVDRDFIFVVGQLLKRSTGQTHAFVAKLKSTGQTNSLTVDANADIDFGTVVGGTGTGLTLITPPANNLILPTIMSVVEDRVLIGAQLETVTTATKKLDRSLLLARRLATSVSPKRGGEPDTTFSGDGSFTHLGTAYVPLTAGEESFSNGFKHRADFVSTIGVSATAGQSFTRRASGTGFPIADSSINVGVFEGETLALGGWSIDSSSHMKKFVLTKRKLDTTDLSFYRDFEASRLRADASEAQVTALLAGPTGLVVAGVTNSVTGSGPAVTVSQLILDRYNPYTQLSGPGKGGTLDINNDLRGDLSWTSTGTTGTDLWAWVSTQTPDPAVLRLAADIRPGLRLVGFVPYKIASLPAASPWSYAGVGDFNGDGIGDVLMRHTNGDLRVLLLDVTNKTTPLLAMQNLEPSSFQILSERTIANVESKYQIRAIADIDGDGYDDIIFDDATGGLKTCDHPTTLVSGATKRALVVFMGPSSVPAQSKLWGAPRPAGAAICGVGDVNSDGLPDIIWSNLTASNVQIDAVLTAEKREVAAEITLSTTDTANRVMLVGDFDGNGTADVFLRNGIQNEIWWLANGNTVTPSVTVSKDTTVRTALALINPVGQGNFKSSGLVNNAYLGNSVNQILWRDTTNNVFSEWLMAKPVSGIVEQPVTSLGLPPVAGTPAVWKLLAPSLNRWQTPYSNGQ